MTKVTMPEPVGYQWLDTGHFRKKVPADADASAFRSLITTDQAEAYAEARVREALEEAASIARENYLAAYAGRVDVDEADDDDRNTEIFNVGQVAQALAYSRMEAAIRALIPATKNEAE